MGFVHLHVHSEYSLLDGACRVKGLVARAKALGQQAVAITDHGVMYGVLDFYKEAVREGIKPIIGCEVYVAARGRKDRVHELDGSSAHLVLLAKNNRGYQNLIALVSEAWIDGFYGKPRVDLELLEKYADGLIALSACLAGQIPQMLLNGRYEEAVALAYRYEEIFGKNNFYIELQDHGLEDQKRVLPFLIRLAKETGIPMVATNDAHYLSKEDAEMQRVLMCIQMNKTIDDKSALAFETEEFYIKSEEEMRALFPSVPEAIENTGKIADRCAVTFEFGQTKLPHFEVPAGKDHAVYFKELCEKGLKERYKEVTPEILERLSYESSVIEEMGFIDYFLIVHDFIAFAKEHGISVGPGRGSGAGSIAAYALGITGIDPLKYQLLFERFLNPERISMPDFDIDFCYERRQEVIDYVVRKYGGDHVAQIITFGTMAAKAAVRDVGRALGMPYARVDEIAKLIPFELNMTIDRALAISKELTQWVETDPDVKRLVQLAKQIEGMPRHASTHAAGVVITRDRVMEYVPLAKNDEAVVTQFTMGALEELGLLKMDFLGLRTLTVISDAEKMIRAQNPGFDIEKIQLDDAAVCDMMAEGNTEGVFQFESAGMKAVLGQLSPEGIEDLIAVISLYRPGPMASIPQYIANRHHPDQITYKHPLLKDILDVTYGCIVYQEQVMQIVRKLAGYSLGRADLVRRAMAKKKHAVMVQERAYFVYGKKDESGGYEIPGCINSGVDEKTANQIFDEMASFASYAFNKSHAACYAILAYQTAYLKYYYPKQYMAAILTSVIDNTDKVIEYTGECERIGVKVLPPDVNTSEAGFTVSGDTIRFGLAAVKNLGRGLIRAMVQEREQNGFFQDFFDFCDRMSRFDFSKRMLEGLIKCGACDGFGYHRRQLLLGYENVMRAIDDKKRRNLEGQLDLFGESGKETDTPYHLAPAEEFTMREILAMERETTGIYLSGHPMEEYMPLAKANRCVPVRDILKSDDSEEKPYKDGDRVWIMGIVAAKRLKATKNNSTMAFITIEDTTGSMEMLVFPKVLETFAAFIKEDAVLMIRGRISGDREENPKLIVEEMKLPGELIENEGEKQPPKRNRRPGLYLKLPDSSGEVYRHTMNCIGRFKGEIPLFIYFEDRAFLAAAPRKLYVRADEKMIRELKGILGNEKVAFVNPEINS